MSDQFLRDPQTAARFLTTTAAQGNQKDFIHALKQVCAAHRLCGKSIAPETETTANANPEAGSVPDADLAS